MLSNKINKNFNRLKNYLIEQNTNCFRIYFQDIPEIPYFIDILADFAIVYERFDDDIDDELKRSNASNNLKEAIQSCPVFQNKSIVIKKRIKEKGGIGFEELAKEQKGEFFEAFENGVKFYFNPYDYLDTGVFLDHRPLRSWIKKDISANQSFLNLFSYTSVVSLFAAFKGARTTNVDLSNTYTAISKKNFELNHFNLAHHHFIADNAFDYLRESQDKFNIIFLDPPTFSNSKKMNGTFDVDRDHVFLIDLAMKRLKVNGILYFSNNKLKFKLEEKVSQKYQVTDLTDKSMPPDFKQKKIHSLFQIKFKFYDDRNE